MRADRILTFGLAVMFGAALWESTSYRWQSGLGILLVCGTGLALAAALCIAMLRAPSGTAATYDLQDAALMLWFWAAIAAVVIFGFALGGSAYVFVYVFVRLEGRARWRSALLSALAVAAVSKGLFDALLGLPLFAGFVFL